MTYAFAATRPINPPGASPVLTEEQVWKALEFKARNPQAFVPMISSCKVVKDEGSKLTRVVRFGDGPEVTEEIEAHDATIVYFTMDTGIQVANVLSYGADDELLLTYSFAGGIPGIDASKPKPSSQELSRTIGGAVQGSIDVIRKGAVEGKW